mgnify:CR=1 FL=1
MGLDFGSKTVGVALSDPLLITAQGLEIIRRKEENKLRQTLARIEQIIVENQVEEIVLGLPKNMNDTEGERVALTMEFKDNIKQIAERIVELKSVGVDLILSGFLHFIEEVEYFGEKVLPLVRELEAAQQNQITAKSA